jgi:hypothetical protein
MSETDSQFELEQQLEAAAKKQEPTLLRKRSSSLTGLEKPKLLSEQDQAFSLKPKQQASVEKAEQ